LGTPDQHSAYSAQPKKNSGASVAHRRKSSQTSVKSKGDSTVKRMLKKEKSGSNNHCVSMFSSQTNIKKPNGLG
jgi:hypothetical protein